MHGREGQTSSFTSSPWKVVGVLLVVGCVVYLCTQPSDDGDPVDLGALCSRPTEGEEDPHLVDMYWLWAHQDDESLHASVAMMRERERGVHNVLVLFTDGAGTRSCRKLKLTAAKCTEARMKEFRTASTYMLGGNFEERVFSFRDGRLKKADVTPIIWQLKEESMKKGRIAAFRGHSPLDPRPKKKYGHPDHVAIGHALQEQYMCKNISDVVMYQLSHIYYGDYRNCIFRLPVSRSEREIHKKIRDIYCYANKSEGRYAMGLKSIKFPKTWSNFISLDECYHFPIQGWNPQQCPDPRHPSTHHSCPLELVKWAKAHDPSSPLLAITDPSVGPFPPIFLAIGVAALFFAIFFFLYMRRQARRVPRARLIHHF